MTTPTNHTTSSLFNFDDYLLEPEPSQDSLDQNSSIEESTMFDSAGGEDFSSAVNSGTNQVGNNDNANANLHPPSKTTKTNNDVPEAATAGVVPTGTTETKTPGGILKKSIYVEPQQRQQQDSQSKLSIDTKPRVDSMTDLSQSQRPQPLSPTVHTSNQTSSFKPPYTSHVLSPTVHRSNQTPGLAAATTEFRCDKHEAQTTITKMENAVDQSAERATAWAIHFALIFFCALIITCVLLTFKVVREYSFLTLVLMAFVVVFCGFLACFVDSTILSQNPKLKPVRQKILTVVQASKKLIEDEYQLFVRDWKEHKLLLTEDGESGLASTTEHLVDETILPTTKTQKPRKKSKVFKMIKPFLGLKKKLGGKGRRRQKTKGDGSGPESITSYQAPEI